MVNDISLIGRLTKNPVLEMVGSKEMADLTIAVQRSYKNADGVYETDFIDVRVWKVIASQVCACLQKGDLLGVKGRLENVNYFDEKEGISKTRTIVVGEKVSFLSSKNKGDD